MTIEFHNFGNYIIKLGSEFGRVNQNIHQENIKKMEQTEFFHLFVNDDLNVELKKNSWCFFKNLVDEVPSET